MICSAQNKAPINTKVSPNLIAASSISLKKYPPSTQANTDGQIDQCNFSENKKNTI